MSTRIGDRGPQPLVAATRTAPRVTPAPNQPFRSVMQAGAQAVVDGAEAAVFQLPGGPVLAAAFRSAPPVGAPSASIYGTTTSALGADSGMPDPETDSAEGSAGSGSSAAALDSAEGLSQNTEQNLYYLQLQQQISEESRQYTALSNVLKARHDMVKNAIGNIR